MRGFGFVVEWGGILLLLGFGSLFLVELFMGLSRIGLSAGGPEFSRVAQGFWRLAEWKLGRKQAGKLIAECVEMGITTFDHADLYGNYTCEGLFGEAFGESGVRREDVEFVTKCGIRMLSENRPEHGFKHYDTGRGHVLASVDNSLAKLGTDYIDLLLIHRPDPLMDAAETAGAFAELKAAGKVRHFGVSNFTVGQFELLQSKMDFPLVTNQVEYSVMNVGAQDDGMLDMCQRIGISPMAWSPLAGGRVFSENTEQSFRVREALGAVGQELGGVAMDKVALAWIMRHPVKFCVVVGTGNVERIRSAVESEAIEMSREQWFAVLAACVGRGVA